MVEKSIEPTPTSSVDVDKASTRLMQGARIPYLRMNDDKTIEAIGGLAVFMAAVVQIMRSRDFAIIVLILAIATGLIGPEIVEFVLNFLSGEKGLS